MDNAKYDINDIRLSKSVRFHTYIAKIFDRKCLLKKFIQELHLDSTKKINKQVLPEKFQIEIEEIDYLYAIRDKIIINDFKHYVSAQNNVSDLIISQKSSIKENEQLITEESTKLNSLKDRLKSETDPNNKIAFQDKISKLTSGICSLKVAVSNSKDLIEKLEKTKITNTKNWKSHIELVEKTIEAQISIYIKGATKKIEKKFGYTSFSHIKALYKKEMENIINGVITTEEK